MKIGYLVFLLFSVIVSGAYAQSTGNSFPTPNGQIAPGSAILVPCGSIVNGQPVVCPPGQANGMQVVCTNCSPSAPIGAATSPVSGTIAVTNTYQLLFAQNSARRACSVQNQGTHNMSIRPVGASAGQVIPPFGIAYCSANSNVTSTDAIEITGTSGDAFVGGSQ